MALSDNPIGAKRQIKSRRAVAAKTNKSWSDSQKIETVTSYLALGNIALVAAVLKIPEDTIRKWKAQEWWKQIENELAVQDNLILSAKMKRLLEKTMDAAEDRIVNGDWIYNNKTGELLRKPPNLRDVHKVTMDLVDKRMVLDGKVPTNVTVEQIDSKLQKLAEKFSELANSGTKRPIEVTDVIYVDSDSSADADGGTGVRAGRPTSLGDWDAPPTDGETVQNETEESDRVPGLGLESTEGETQCPT